MSRNVRRDCLMDHKAHAPLADDHAFPMGFIVMPAFVGALVWLAAMLSRLAP